MSRKGGQIIARDERRWLVRVYLGRDRETRKRTYYNRTIYGSLRFYEKHLHGKGRHDSNCLSAQRETGTIRCRGAKG